MMRILADENCDRMIVGALRSAGHDVISVLEINAGAEDEEIFRLAKQEGCAILTDDLDFGRLAEREADCPSAVILMRLDPLGRESRAKRVVEILRMHAHAMEGHLLIIEPGQVRLRPLSKLSRWGEYRWPA